MLMFYFSNGIACSVAKQRVEDWPSGGQTFALKY